MAREGKDRYVRSTRDAATPHLYLGGKESDLVAAQPILRLQLGAIYVSDVLPARMDNHKLFATFEDDAAAAAALVSITSSAPIWGSHAEVVQQAKNTAPAEALEAALSAESCGIPGLHIIPDFVSADTEAVLLEEADGRPWDNLSRRRVQHYGRIFNYIARTVDKDTPANPVPPRIQAVMAQVAAVPCVGPLDQVTVNEYSPGVGINSHVETHSAFGECIACLSLAGPAVMVFRREDQQKALFLPPRSLLVVSGEARLAWSHCIPHRQGDVLEGGEYVARAPRRVSLTFRQVRQAPCACEHPTLCDDQQGSIPLTRAAERAAAADAAAQQLEDSNVRDVYDAIAPHFSATRFSVWPAVRRFIEGLPRGALVADVGCGNGKYFAVRRDVFTSGSDRSSGLAAVAARRLTGSAAAALPRADVAVADALRLPYRAGSCDAVLCIAVLHHMATVERRVALLRELARTLAPRGRALVTVWATEQENMKKVAKWQPLKGDEAGPEEERRESGEHAEAGDQAVQDYLVPWHLPLHRAEAAAAAGSADRVDKGKDALVFRRYYHLFAPGELEGLVKSVPGVDVAESFYDKDNWCVVMEKIKQTR